MKTKLFSAAIIIISTKAESNPANGYTSYLIGLVIALFLMGYLVYSLIKPDKF